MSACPFFFVSMLAVNIHDRMTALEIMVFPNPYPLNHIRKIGFPPA
jgi:hypothetical protein